MRHNAGLERCARFVRGTVAVAGVCVLLTACGGGGSDESSLPSYADVGGDLFSVVPLDAADFHSLAPLGNLNPSGHVFPTDHHYFFLTAPMTVVPVKAPGRIWITQVRAFEHVTAGFTDYTLVFRSCREVWGRFDHLSALDAGILTQAGTLDPVQTYSTGGETFRMSSKDVLIEIPAGAVIATAGGHAGQYALDFGVYDDRVVHTFVNPSRFSDQYLHAVPCLDFYDAANRDTLRGLCGSSGAERRTIEPVGGTVVQDIAGTAQGVWFNPAGDPNHEDEHLALVHDNVDPTVPVFSVGTSIGGLASGTYRFVPQPAGLLNRDFSAIAPDGNVYAYTGLRGPGSPDTVLLVQLSDATTLRIECRTAADGPPWAFAGNSVTFTR